jgi:alpha-tubulin suppressor-like RCC1 family protein
VRTDKSLWCWGRNNSGQLGDGTLTQRPAPVQVGTGVDWTKVSAGGGHSCGLRGEGTLWCWGNNVSGQLGDPTISGDAAKSPSQIGTEVDWHSVSLGLDHTVGLRD